MKQMPKDTILFISDKNDAGIAYEYGYFRDNFVSPSSVYQKIYYKSGNTRDTWIDYKKAIQCKTGSRLEKIAQASEDVNFLININQIPAVTLIRENGVEEQFAPYDGYYEHQLWMKRNDTHLNLPAICKDVVTAGRAGDIDINNGRYIVYYWQGDDLHAEFPNSIENAIISLNMLFLEYVEISSTHIAYRSIKPLISKYFGFDENDPKIYDLRFNVYKWDGLIKKPVITPVEKNDDDNLFLMSVDMEQNAFIFWHGVFYTYEIMDYNKKLIRINGVDSSMVDKLKLDDILVYRMVSNDEKMETHMYIHCGVNNRYKNSVDFLLPVCDSLIVYNGVDHEYTVEDDNAIDYHHSIYSLVSGVTYISKVLSINFTKV